MTRKVTHRITELADHQRRTYFFAGLAVCAGYWWAMKESLDVQLLERIASTLEAVLPFTFIASL